MYEICIFPRIYAHQSQYADYQSFIEAVDKKIYTTTGHLCRDAL